MIHVEAVRDVDAVYAALVAAGVSDDGAKRLAIRFARVIEHLGTRGHGHVRAWWVPGRIEVLGKHTDYAGGESLVVAIEHGFVVAAAARVDERIVTTDVGSRETVDFATDDGPAWRRYPEAALSRLARDWTPERGPGQLGVGLDIAFESDLPPAAGLSSSTALITGTVLAAKAFARFDTDAWNAVMPTATDLAAYLGAIECGGPFRGLAGGAGVGTEGGVQDSTAICCATPRAIAHFRYAPTIALGTVPLRSDLVFVVGASGVVAEKTGAARDRYNRASRLAAEAATIVSRCQGEHSAHLGDAVAALGADGVRKAVADASPEIVQRVEHFLAESVNHVPGGRAAFAAGSDRDLADVVASSVRDAERWLENQIPETLALTELASTHGAIAASPFGAGYGGSVWALVRRDDKVAFTAAWRDAYAARCPAQRGEAAFFVTESGPAAFELALE